MPLLSFFRLIAALASLAILVFAGYLLWSWYDGDWVRDAAGDLVRQRDAWRLWTGVALLAWSLLGRPLVLLLAARRGQGGADTERSEGQMIAGRSGASLYVETFGPAGAPPIIFTHGWGMDSTFWNQAKRDLGDRFRLVVWDLPGLGRSKAATETPISLEAFADNLAELVEVSGPQPAVLVGHSIGGMVIQTLLRDHPQIHRRIAGVALLNTTYVNPLRTMALSRLALALQRPVLEPMMKLSAALKPLVWASKWQSYFSGSAHLAMRLGFGRAVTRDQLEHVTLLATRSPPDVEARGNLAMFHWDGSGALDGSPLRAMVIGGEVDLVTKPEASRTIARSSDAARLELVEGANHLGPLEAAETYDRLIADFVLDVQPGVVGDLPPRNTAAPGRRRDAQGYSSEGPGLEP